MTAHAEPQDYARAIFDLALDGWLRQLRDVKAALTASAALTSAAADASLPVSHRLRLLETAAAPGGLSQGVRNTLGTLLDSGQIGMLGSILAELEQLAKPRAERRIARVTSAVALTAAEQAAFRDRLAAKFGSDLDLHFSVDSALIGGILLRVGDQVIDGSVAGKLAAMHDRLTAVA